jgi:hypothetical protein
MSFESALMKFHLNSIIYNQIPIFGNFIHSLDEFFIEYFRITSEYFENTVWNVGIKLEKGKIYFLHVVTAVFFQKQFFE